VKRRQRQLKNEHREVTMTRIETARVKEVLEQNISEVKEAAGRLNAATELQELETGVADLEKALGELKSNMAGLPYKHSV
jgi:hypothetical protein